MSEQNAIESAALDDYHPLVRLWICEYSGTEAHREIRGQQRHPGILGYTPTAIRRGKRSGRNGRGRAGRAKFS